MSTSSFHVRIMLHQYKHQLVASRRLTHYQQALEGTGDSTFSAETKRRIMVERVAQEVYDNLLFTGNTMPVVQQVYAALVREFGNNLMFHYPPGSLEVVMTRRSSQGHTEEVSPHFRKQVIQRAWELALGTVDETML